MKKRDLSKEKKFSDDEGDSLILIKELKNLNSISKLNRHLGDGTCC